MSRPLGCGQAKAGAPTYFQLLGLLPQRVAVDLQLLRSLGTRLPGQDVLQLHIQFLLFLVESKTTREVNSPVKTGKVPLPASSGGPGAVLRYFGMLH